MKVTAFLIKYGEIAIKGKNRYMFEDALMKQIRHAMAPVGDFKVRKESGRMFVEAQDEFDYDEAVEALQRVFGIVGICPMIIEENKDMELTIKVTLKPEIELGEYKGLSVEKKEAVVEDADVDAAVEELRSAVIRHNTECDVDKMGETVKNILGIA